MSYAKQLLDTYPRDINLDAGQLAATIDALSDCAQACTACADACIGEGDMQMLARCVRLNLDCADVCEATGRILSRQTATETQMLRTIVQACVEACGLCAEECENHSEHGIEHCRMCAEACRCCEQACNSVLSAI